MTVIRLRIPAFWLRWRALSFDEEEWFLIVMNAVGWPALLAALYFWGPT